MVSSVSPVTGWFLVRVTFTKQYLFFEVFLSVLRVLTQFLLIFEVFELKFNVEISFWGISYSRLLILSHFLLFSPILSHFLLSTIFSYDLKQLVTLVTTGDSQKYIYIGGEYGRQLNVIDFWGFFNWWHNWWQLVTLQELLKTKSRTQELAQNLISTGLLAPDSRCESELSLKTKSRHEKSAQNLISTWKISSKTNLDSSN